MKLKGFKKGELLEIFYTVFCGIVFPIGIITIISNQQEIIKKLDKERC